MLKRIALITIVAIVLLIPILSFLPTSYQITVHSSRYYGNCSDNNYSDSRCKVIDPPVVLVKSEPYIRAWWNKTQTERQFAVKEVTTEWTNKGSAWSGKQTSGILAVSIILIELVILFGIVYLFISTLIKAFRLKGSEKIAWLCLIVFVFPLGSIIYALVKPETK